jgi:hypothetical protein
MQLQDLRQRQRSSQHSSTPRRRIPKLRFLQANNDDFISTCCIDDVFDLQLAVKADSARCISDAGFHRRRCGQGGEGS